MGNIITNKILNIGRRSAGASQAYGAGQGDNQRGSGGSWLGTILMLAVIGLIVALGYRYFTVEGSENYTTIPKEITITYVPSDFHPSIDEANAVRILSDPNNNKKEFNDLVFQLNMDLLNHVGSRMGLPSEMKKKVEEEYRTKHHNYLKQLYFNDFVALQDTTSNTYQSFYQNQASNAVEALNEVASKYTCFLVNSVVINLLKSDAGRLGVKGLNVNTPCGMALGEGLNPLVKRLRERAAIDDFSKSKGMINERVEKYITELATFEIRDKKALSKQISTKVLGYDVSTSDLEITAISVAKLGFKLDQYLNISLDAKAKRLVVALPQPTILSHEVFPKVDKLDIGWLRDVSNVDFNKNFNALRTEFRRDALEAENMSKAKEKAKEVMNMLFNPVLSKLGKEYKLAVSFKNTGGEVITEELKE
jgi:Protein of unknown function (DUF4230)